MNGITFLSPQMGDFLLDGVGGTVREGRLYVPVRVKYAGSRLLINEVEAAAASDGTFEAAVPLDGVRCRIEAASPDGCDRACITVLRLKDAQNTFRFTIDDCIIFFEDLTRHQDEYKSIFENPFLAIFKRAHDLYGSRVHFNIFFESVDGTFNLSMMTDKFRDEFIRNASWMTFSFHSQREFPGAPYNTSSYEEVYRDCMACNREIIRFASREALSGSTTLHFGACTIHGARALRACGYRALCGFISLAPDGRRRVSYHLTTEQVLHAEHSEGWYDAEEDIAVPKIDLVLNDDSLTADRVEPFLDELEKKPAEGRMIQMVIHEQYFYADYSHYEPDYAERILTMARWMQKHGYRSVSMSDLIAE